VCQLFVTNINDYDIIDHSNPLLKSPLQQSNQLYQCNVTFGTPPQRIPMTFVTDTDMISVPAADCESVGMQNTVCGNENAETYNATASTTAERGVSNYQYYPDRLNSRYGTLSAVRGAPYSDRLSFHNPAPNSEPLYFTSKIRFHAITKSRNGDFGVFGLSSWPRISAPGAVKSVTELLGHEANQPLISIHMKDCRAGCAHNSGGWMVFGAADAAHCAPVKHWIATTPVGHNNGNVWQFPIECVEMGQHTQTNVIAVLGISSPSILMPHRDAADFARSLGAQEWGQDFIVPCATTVTMTLTIGGRKYEIPDDLMKQKLDAEKCRLEIAKTYEESSGTSRDGSWSMGMTLMRTHCFVLDFGEKRIGIADIIPDKTEELVN